MRWYACGVTRLIRLKCVRHLVCRPEAAQGGDALDGVVGVLEQVLRAADSLGAQPLERRRAGRLAEAPGVGARAHHRLAGEIVDRQRQLEMLPSRSSDEPRPWEPLAGSGCFQSFAGGPLDEADQALDRAALFISQHIGTPARRPRRRGTTDQRFPNPSPNRA